MNYMTMTPSHTHCLAGLFCVTFWFSGCYPLPARTMNHDQLRVEQPGLTYSVFYETLRPYGSWMDHPRFGFVWVPNVEPGFFPYGTNGYWLYTDMGWTWYSYYSWGWGPFHYGRWFYDPFYGWAWVPGYQWSCAWVVWRYSDGYYGWAPIGPGISQSFAFSDGYYLPHTHWRFIQNRNMGRKDVDHYFAGFGGYMDYLRNSKLIQNIREDVKNKINYHAGPPLSEVEKATKKSWQSSRIASMEKPGQQMKGQELYIYKPEISERSSQSKPNKVERWNGKAPEDLIELNQIEHDLDRIRKEEKLQLPKDEKENIRPIQPPVNRPVRPEQELRPPIHEAEQPKFPPEEKPRLPEQPSIPKTEMPVHPPIDKPIPLPKTDMPRKQDRNIRLKPPVIQSIPQKPVNGKKIKPNL
jgi:hypothetical protein